MNDELSKILRKMLVQNEDDSFYANFYMQIQREYTDKVNKIQFALNGINLKILINPEWILNTNKETIIYEISKEAKHITEDHFTKGYIKNSNRDMMNICFDLTSDTNKQRELSLPNKQIPRWYYLHLINPDYKDLNDPKDKSLREINPDLANIIDNLLINNADIQEWERVLGVDLQYHLIWDNIQEMLDLGDSVGIISLIEDQINHLIVNAYKSCGHFPSNLKQKIMELLHPKKAIYNWKLAFRRCLGNSFSEEIRNSRMRESRRFEDSIGHRHKLNSSILVAIDTSGSISNKEIIEFFNELYHIHKTGAKVHILECDAKIQKEYDYKGGIEIPEIKGRGGTSYKPIIKYWNDHNKEYDAFICFTDGYAPLKEINPIKKMIWVISSNGYQEKVYPNGICIFIPKEEGK